MSSTLFTRWGEQIGLEGGGIREGGILKGGGIRGGWVPKGRVVKSKDDSKKKAKEFGKEKGTEGIWEG